MTEQEILEGNSLIENFMGYLIHRKHVEWNDLMPIWFKIRDLRFKEVKHEFEHADIKQNCAHAICYRDIQSAYHEIVNAIKWYNTITK